VGSAAPLAPPALRLMAIWVDSWQPAKLRMACPVRGAVRVETPHALRGLGLPEIIPRAHRPGCAARANCNTAGERRECQIPQFPRAGLLLQ